MRRRSLLAACVLAGLAGGFVASARAERPLSLGFVDPAFSFGGGAPRSALLDEARALGASVVRVPVPWSLVAPAERPRDFDATDPASPAYRWSVIDTAVQAASARGLRVLLSFSDAPRWAEGPGRPRTAMPGSWRPRPTAVGAFATAAARRYSGAFPDPGGSGTLPRVRYWQVWNEPNLSLYLSPQWARRRGRWRPASPAHYRSMLNAAYAGIKRVRRSNFVVSAGNAPYGLPDPGGTALRPVRFTRELFCLRGRRLRPARCPDPARLDAIAHHPYSVRGARSRALNADDASVPDVGKLTRIVRAAVRKRRALPRGRKRTWVTEVSWDSRPPDPDGVPARTQARWLAEAFYLLWRQGVDTIAWFHVRDELPRPSYAATYQSGVLFADGRPKPAARAFRFPFVLDRGRGGRVRAWGKPPAGGPIVIEQRAAGRWRTLAALRRGRGQVFFIALRLRGTGAVRARAGGDVSLPYRLR